MADLNIRNVDPELIARLKAEAALGGVTLRDRCVFLLSGSATDHLSYSSSPTFPDQPKEAAARVALSIPGVSLGMPGKSAMGDHRAPVVESEPEPKQCEYKEWSGDLGCEVRCGKAEHNFRVKHGNWQQV